MCSILATHMKKMPKTFMSELGISNGAEDVYSLLIKSGSLLIADISKQTGQFRVDTYKYIDELILNELVIQVKVGKRKRYEAVSPEVMYSILKKKESRVIEGVSEMCKIFDGQKNSFGLEVFSGRDGLRLLYDTLVVGARKNAQLLRIESPHDFKLIRRHYSKEYFKRSGFRSGGDLEKFVITNPSTMTGRQRSLNRSAKTVSSKFEPFKFDFTTVIIEDRIAFIDSENEKGVLLRDERFAEYMKAIFWMLYGFL